MPPNSACLTFIPLLSPFIDGELVPSDRVNVERHMSACKECTGRAADLRAESALLRVGLDMAADEVDFKDFAQKVMARVTPERPPFFDRVKLSLSEMFLYQKPMLVSGFAMAMVAVVAVTALLSNRTPLGYASERMAVEQVSTSEEAKVAPVVLETQSGDAIIWLVDSEEEAVVGDPAAAPSDVVGSPAPDEAESEELDISPTPHSPNQKALQQDRPKGGEL